MPRESIYKNVALTFEIEDTLGQPKADTPTSVLLTEEASVKPLEGEKKELQYDTKGAHSRAKPIQQLEQLTVFSFKAPMTRPAAGEMPSWLNVFRGCGFNIIETDATYELRHAPPNEQDSATVRLYQEADTSSDHLYMGVGGSGNLSLEFQANQLVYLDVSNFITRYVRPDLTNRFDPSYGTQLSNVCETANYLGTNAVKLNNVDLCLEKLTISNVDGRGSLGMDHFFCGDKVAGEEQSITMEAIFVNPDWNTEFNPWELAESFREIQRVPFLFDHDLMRVYAAEVQPIEPEVVELGKAKIKGIKMGLNVLSELELSVRKVV